jgi:hypothetical protein
MKHLLITAASLTIAAVGLAAVPAEAGPFDKLKKAVKKVEKTAEDANEVVDTVDDAQRTNGRSLLGAAAGGRTVATATGGGGRAGPVPAKYASLTQCAGLPIDNAFIGKWGDYTFQKGLSQESRSGVIDREPVSASNGCFMPSMGSGDVLYVEVPAKQWAAMKGGWKMQCVDMATGQNANPSALPSWSNVSGKDVMLHTGNSLGYTPTASGSNSSRSGAWDADLERRGMHMLGFNMPNLHTDKGTDFYCQYYNEASGKSVVAFAYRRSATMR